MTTRTKALKRSKTITVKAAESLEALDRFGSWVWDDGFDTLKAAKARAKYCAKAMYLTEEHMNDRESSTRLCYSQVLVNDEVVEEYFA